MAPRDPQGDIDQLIAGLPATADGLRGAARQLVQRGRHDLAIDALRRGVDRSPTLGLRVDLGALYSQVNRHKDCMAEMVAVLRQEPGHPTALLLLSRSLVECGEYDRASKMLDRASRSGADQNEVEELGHRIAKLTGQTSQNSLSELLGGEGERTSEQPPSEKLEALRRASREELEAEGSTRPKLRTAVGRPSPHASGADLGGSQPAPTAGHRLRAPAIESGGYPSLGTYELPNDDDDTLGHADDTVDGPTVHEFIESDATFDQFTVDDPTTRVSDVDIADPDDKTAHLQLDEVFVDPDATELSEAELFDELEVEPIEEFGYADLSEVFEEEEPVRPISGGEDRTVRRDSPRSPAPPARGPAARRPAPTERPREQSPPPRPSPAAGPPASRPAPPPRQPQPQPQPQPQQQPQPPHVDGQPSGADRYLPTEPVLPGAAETNREMPAKAGASALGGKLPMLLTVGLGLVLVGGIGAIAAAGYTQSGDIEGMVAQAHLAREADTYDGYLAAEAKLAEASDHASFLGSRIDRIINERLPAIPGVDAWRLKRQAVADLAHVASTLEYRFEKPGSHQARERIETAERVAPGAPRLTAASILIDLAEGNPHRALSHAESGGEDQVNPVVDAARVMALIELERPLAAARAAKPLRTVDGLGNRERFLLGQVDRQLGDRGAVEHFDALIEANPDHVDARIERSYLLRKNDDELADARKSLEEVLGPLKNKASRYQLARALVAQADLQLAEGEPDQAEQTLREAVSKMPERGELYEPLIDFYFARGRYDGVATYIEKARQAGVVDPDIVLAEAKLSYLTSQPRMTVQILGDADFEDARKDWLHGLALLDLEEPAAARDAFAAAGSRPSEFVAPAAFVHVARLAAPDAAEEDGPKDGEEDGEPPLEAIEALLSENPRDPYVHWAAGRARLHLAEEADGRDARQEQLGAARKALEKAIELAPRFPVFYVDLCRVHLHGLDLERARKACGEAIDIAPGYAPGRLTLAKLMLREGRVADARKLIVPLRDERPDDPKVGLMAARVHLEIYELDEASAELDRWATEPAGASAEAKLLEGRIEYARANYGKASGYLKAAHELRPDDGEAAVYYGLVLARLGQLDEAGGILLDVLSHPTQGGHAWLALGEVRRRQDRLRDAFENLRKAEEHFEETPPGDVLRARLHKERALAYGGRHGWEHRLVAENMEEALSVAADDPEVSADYGYALLKRKEPDLDAAAAAYQRVLDRTPLRCDILHILHQLHIRREDEQGQATTASQLQEHCPAAADEQPGEEAPAD